MSTENTSRDPDPRDPLDELLQQAAFPEPDPNSIVRLERFWKQVSADRHRRNSIAQRLLWISAIAAAVLFAVSLWWFRAQRPAGVPEIAQPQHRPPELPVDEPNSLQRAEDFHPVDAHPLDVAAPVRPPDEPMLTRQQPVVSHEVLVRSRPANAYELVVFQAALRRRQAVTVQDRSSDLKAAIERLADDPSVEVAQVAKQFLPARELHERMLLRLFPELDDTLHPAAISLLSHVGSRDSIPLLIDLSRNDRTHRPAVRALAKLGSPAALGQLIRNEQDSDLRRELLSALLSRNERAPLAVYLDFVRNPATRDETLAVLNKDAKPPVELLFEALGSSQQLERLAAARVLGELNDPHVDRRLIRIAQADASRQEVLLALLTSDSEEATRFLQSARQDLFLVVAVRTAEFQLQTMSN